MRYSEPFGICQNYKPYENEKILRRDLDAIQRAGIKWLRTDFNWNHIERRKGSFRLEIYDKLVKLSRERGINLLPVICYSPIWMAQHWNFPPEDFERFAKFACTLVKRYKEQVHHWEIWNEADSYFFWVGTPEEYADLLKLTYNSMKETDPTCKVLMCGLSDSATYSRDFLEKIVKETGGKYFDLLNFHIYPEIWNRRKAEDWEQILKKLRKNRLTAKKPVWITETGYGITSRSQMEVQACSLVRIFSSLLGSGVPERIFWHRLRDTSSLFSRIYRLKTGRKRARRRFGTIQGHSLLEAYLKPIYDVTYPAYFAYANLIRALSQNFRKSEAEVEPRKGISIQTFDKYKEKIMIAWSRYEGEREELALGASFLEKKSVTVRSIFGEELGTLNNKMKKVFRKIPLSPRKPVIIKIK